MSRTNRSGILLLVLSALVMVAGVNCTNLAFIKKRLPPPYRSEGGYLFQFASPSAQIVQLCGNWETNDW